MSLVTGITSVVAEVISAVSAVCTNSHSAGLASSAMAELLRHSPVIKAVTNVSMFFMFSLLNAMRLVEQNFCARINMTVTLFVAARTLQ